MLTKATFLRVVAVVIPLLAAATAIAQCEPFILRQNNPNVDPTTPPSFRFVGGPDSYPYPNADITWKLTGLRDPGRPSKVSGGSVGPVTYHGIGSPDPVASCGYTYLRSYGNGLPLYSQTSPYFGWPPDPEPSGDGEGFYKLEYDFNNGTTLEHLEMKAWLVNHVFTTSPPVSEPPTSGWGGSGGGGGAPSSLIVTVYQDGAIVTTGVPVRLKREGGNDTTAITGATGQVHWDLLPVGYYLLSVDGWDGSSRVYIAGSTRNFYNLNYTGTTLEDVTGPGAGGGNADPGFWRGLFESLFVPSDATITSLHDNFDSLVNWGPFGIINDVMNQIEVTHDGIAGTTQGLGFVPPTFHMEGGFPVFTAGGESVEIVPATRPAWYPMIIRTTLGYCIYAVFFFLVFRWIRPKFVNSA